MKNTNALLVFILLSFTICLTSCEAIAGIFKAGMGFGIFLVVAMLAALIGVIMWIAKGRNK